MADLREFRNYLQLEKHHIPLVLFERFKQFQGIWQSIMRLDLKDAHYPWCVISGCQNLWISMASRSINRKMSSLKVFYKYSENPRPHRFKHKWRCDKSLKISTKVQVPIFTKEGGELFQQSHNKNVC
jgi:hypothetical protein